MDSEIKSLEKNDTWQIVDKSKDKKIIDIKWICKRKSDNNNNNNNIHLFGMPKRKVIYIKHD